MNSHIIRIRPFYEIHTYAFYPVKCVGSFYLVKIESIVFNITQLFLRNARPKIWISENPGELYSLHNLEIVFESDEDINNPVQLFTDSLNEYQLYFLNIAQFNPSSKKIALGFGDETSYQYMTYEITVLDRIIHINEKPCD
jgi:hypothetical protein